MLIYCTVDTLALGLMIQAFNEDEQRRKLHKLLTLHCLFSSCWLMSWQQRTKADCCSYVVHLRTEEYKSHFSLMCGQVWTDPLPAKK